MENNNENLGFNGFYNKNIKQISEIISKFIKSSLNLKKDIRKDDNNESCMLKLLRDTMLCNLLYRFIGYQLLTSEDNTQWQKLDDKINKYIDVYFDDDKFNLKLLKLYEYYNSKKMFDYALFLTKMINKFNLKKNKEITKTIFITENKITNILNTFETIKINKLNYDKSMTIIKSETNNSEIISDEIKIKLNYVNYITLISMCNNDEERNKIEQKMLSTTDKALNDFSKLIVYRHKLANDNNYLTYFKYIKKNKNNNEETIKDLIKEINIHNDKRLITLFSKLNISKKKLTNCDIIKYLKETKNNNMFDLDNVIINIIKFIEQHFFVKINKIRSSNNIIVYEILNNKKLLGRLFLDLLQNKNKKFLNPIAMKITDTMTINIGEINKNPCAEMMILGNFKNEITYYDIVSLFREFGNIINNILYISRVGSLNYDEEFANYYSSLFEYFAWNVDTIKMIIKSDKKYCDVKNINVIIEHILLTRDLEICYNLKIKCINAKFDHLIHNSIALINIISKAIQTKDNAKLEILETYKKIYQEFMLPLNNFVCSDIEYINQNLIMQQISGSQGLFYSKLMNEIFAYGCYWLIINKKKKNIFEYFMHDGITNQNTIIKKFLMTDNREDSINYYFNLYITDVIKGTINDDCITETAQYFEDIYDEGDTGDIIEITKM